MKKHIGSTAALVFGVLAFISGVVQLRPVEGTTSSGDLLISGLIIVLGALSYRSAKKRYLGEKNGSLLRKIFELTAIIVILAAVLLQNNTKEQTLYQSVHFISQSALLL